MAGILRLWRLLGAGSILVILAACPAPSMGQALPPLPPMAPGAPAPPAEAPGTVEDRLIRLEEQNRLLMEQNRRLAEQLEALTGQYRTIDERLGPSGARADVTAEGGAGARDNPAGADRIAPGPGFADLAGPVEDVTAEGGTGARDNPAEAEAKERPARTGRPKFPIVANFGPGFELMTEDQEFQLQFHNYTQIEYRAFDHTGQGTVHDGFFLPRQVWYMTGRITKPIEFYTGFQKGLGSVNIRDAFLNFHYDDRLMFKAGRYKVPYTYEYYAISSQDLIQPERSLFAANFGDSRELGAMAWGRLFDERLDYAAGMFNGPRNSFEDFNDAQDIIAYLHARPFAKNERLTALGNLGVGGSVDFGNQNNPALPDVLRTATAAATNNGAATAAPAFLAFNPAIRENGDRALWNLHATYFYKGLSLLAEWDSGFANYAPGEDLSRRTRVPISGYYVSAGYFLTGETVPRRTQVDVIRPFSLKDGERGLGALEVQARYSALNVGREVFTGGLADPNLWSNNASTVDVGLNWYLNRYVKVYFDWQHAMFGDPVIFRQGVFHQTSNLYWVRLQIYF